MAERDIVSRLRKNFEAKTPTWSIQGEAATEIECLRSLNRDAHAKGYDNGWAAATRANKGREG